MAVYAIARIRDGSIAYEVLTRQEIDARRNRSQSSGSGPWVTDYASMARKTGLRLLFAGGLVPLSAGDRPGDRGRRRGRGLHRRDGEEDNKTRLGAMDSLRGLLQRSEVASDDGGRSPRPAARHRLRPRPPGPVLGAVRGGGIVKETDGWHEADARGSWMPL